MTAFSANLGFLWTDWPLADAIRAAHAAGFDAVECHWPYDQDAAAVKAALADTGLRMLGLNAPRGDVAAGENGLAALVGREAEARAGIDAALDYAEAIDAANIHVLSGFAGGAAAEACFIENLRYAAGAAAAGGRTILIEPLNQYDAPGYFLNHTDLARRIIEAVGAPNLRLMFDCYHVQILEGDLTRRIDANLDIIGHVQFAGVPSRGRPDIGEVNYAHIFAHLTESGWHAPLGAEYRPENGDTDGSLGWMASLRQ
ncbi:MAG: TIM barrel protein [Pseudomonadota bacterium]|nr:TIM barrel protein [Pseudomonadota bacterium]